MIFSLEDLSESMKILTRSLEIARALAPTDFKKEERRCFHFSFIWKNSSLITIGQNNLKTNAKNRFNLKENWILNKKTCSELAAFTKIKSTFNIDMWRRLSMVNVRIDRNGEIRNSHPCPACRNLIAYINPSSVWFTNNLGEFEQY